VSITAIASEASRHLVLRASGGESLPEAIVAALREHAVGSGWLRASGVLSDVELRAYDAELGALGSTRRIAGPVHVLALEGSIGQADGEPSFSMRALLARESDRGLETLAGEIATARAVALEVLVTSFDDVTLERALDTSAGVWLIGSGASAPVPQATRTPAARPAASPAWSAALEASERADAVPARPRPDAAPAGLRAPARSSGLATAGSGAAVAIPPRPARPEPDLDSPFPEPGDVVDHFAFGPCDVVKSDGDRLHLRVRKDGRIREIALEMLRVSPLEETDDGKRRFRLERRL
jgi:predicted DNA-binding protein with PD1-like motif